ncbi:MAG TPA: DNA polymerase III subunit gamma/tau [Candidatus Saccharimonadales bacterium]|jgi:DNA polymerase-3 subunit gamma/tau|nr:DNA polymerase III subunit gamma/tau [Candidatus Saccharimonadales bacterium]
MGQALYRTHRPQKFADVVGQEHIITALTRALKKGTVSHAYLFTGPRGTGKTSIARILAHEINGVPYTDDSIHLDIIEIDAASNRRIDEIRDLRDKVHIAPTSAKYKVYIIDEVHMLTKEAFNALLKTLEEPPAHVVFILATTEAHKLPETIISRTQRFAFKPVDLPQVAGYLRTLATAENIDIADDALALIAAHGDGSFRDSISLLDQIRNSGDKVTLADVQAMLGIAPKELIETLLAGVAAHDPVTVAQLLLQLQTAGHDSAQVAKQLGATLRNGLLEGKPALPSDQLMQLLAKLIEVPSSGNPRAYLEIALLDIALIGAGLAPNATPVAPKTAKPEAPAPAKKTLSQAVPATQAVQVEPHPSTFNKPAVKPTALTPPAETEYAATSDATLTIDAWPAVLAAVKSKYSTLYSVIRTARPHFEPGKVVLEFGYAFHQKRIQETKNREIIATIITSVTNEDLAVQCIVGEGQDPNNLPAAGPPQLPPEEIVVHTVAKPQPAAAPQTPATPEVSAISNIFGGAEVLES